MIYDDARKLILTPNSQATVLENKRLVRQGRFGTDANKPQPRIVASAANLVVLMNSAFIAESKDKVSVWVPEALLPGGLKLVSKQNHTSKGKARTVSHSTSTLHIGAHASGSGLHIRRAAPSEKRPEGGMRWLGLIDLSEDNLEKDGLAEGDGYLKSASTGHRLEGKEIIDLTQDD